MANELVELQELQGHTDRVWHIAWDPAGRTLASCGTDLTIRVWQASSAQNEGWVCIATLEEAQSRTIRSCDWSRCGKFLAAASFDATVAIWERSGATFELIATLEGHENEVKGVAWNPAGTLIATCSRDKSVWLWDSDPDNDFECVSVMHGHEQDVKSVCWHPTRPLLFSSSYDDTIKVWAEDADDDDWSCMATLRGHTSTVWGVAHRSDGERSVSCSDDASLIVWVRQDDGGGMHGAWRNGCALSGYHTRCIFSVDFASSGAIASGGADDTICVFQEAEGSSSDAPTYELIGNTAGAHDGDVNCVRFCPKDASLLASAGDDGMVRLWRVNAQTNSVQT
eukprot:g2073.t1